MTANKTKALISIVIAVVVIGGLALWRLDRGGRTPADAEQSLVVQPRPFTATLTVVGNVTPGSRVDIVAPFDGTVQSVGFDYGRPVAAGAALVVMDDFDLQQHQREAQSAYLKAAQAAKEMDTWSTGAEVSRARRGVTTAELDLRDSRRKADETKALFERGLVARTELDSLEQEQRTRETALAAAREDLAAALRKGEGDNRQIVDIDLQNTRARLDEVTGQQRGQTVRAPVAGVVVHPPATKAEGPGEDLHAGQRVVRGQLLGAIASAGGLSVALKLNEGDANRVREGQAVSVTGPGFATVVSGRIASVAAEATAGDAGIAGSTFSATARLDPLTPAQAQTIRIGMTATVTITTYAQARAMVVPLEAVAGAAPNAFVTVKGASGPPGPRPVVLGEIAPDGVEIRKGLKPGDVIVWRVAKPAGPPQ